MKRLFSIVFLSLFCFSMHAQADILEKLSAIQGLTASEVIPSPKPGYRVFEIKFMQPENHLVESSPQFSQRLVLWHKDESRPMVLQTSGYSIFSLGLSALAQEFNANQVQVEHRFFSSSVPSSNDWTLHNIEQSAGDFHRITVALKEIYKAKWVNTGRSKGGMTSVYHRKFYPNDVDATVAHVAPHSFSLEDERYADFVSLQIGGERNAQCRADLVASQEFLLNNRNQILEKMTGDYEQLGSKEVAFEHTILELPWAFWQYSGPASDCANVPKASDSLEKHSEFLFNVNDPNGYNDEGLGGFVPYYFQAATQLGNPGSHFESLLDLLNFEDTFTIKAYLPKNVPAEYDNAVAMREVSQWLRTASERILFVYGEFDPWTAGAYEDVRSEGDNYRLDVPGMNHGAQFVNLNGEARELAYSKLRTWLNISGEVDEPVVGRQFGDRELQQRKGKTLEQKEFEAQKKLRIRL